MLQRFVVFLLNLSHVFSAKILLGSMHTSRSHIGSMMPVAVALQKSGYEIHVVETSSLDKPFNYPDGINSTFINVPSNNPFFRNLLETSWMIEPKPKDYHQIFKFSEEGFEKIVETKFDELAPVLNTTWDLIIVDELFSSTTYAIALRNHRLYKMPYIIFSTTILGNIFSAKNALGRTILARPPDLQSQMEDGKFDVTNFFQRIKIFHEFIVTYVLLTMSCEYFQSPAYKAISFERFSFQDLWIGSTYNFLEDINHLAFPSPIASDTISIGAHCPNFKKLPADYVRFMEDKSSRGTILIAMGSNISWKKAPQPILDAFNYVINNLRDYRIIFVYDVDNEVNYPPHVKVVKWSPQWSILSHNSTRLFITHGGIKSVKEAICSETPMLLLPLFAEQTHNRDFAQKLGIARSLNKLDVDPERMLNMALDLLMNPKYKEEISRCRKLFTDRPMPAMTEAKFWTDRAIRIAQLRESSGLIKERPIFKRKGSLLSNIEYFYGFHVFSVFTCLVILSTK